MHRAYAEGLVGIEWGEGKHDVLRARTRNGERAWSKEIKDRDEVVTGIMCNTIIFLLVTPAETRRWVDL